MNTKDITKEKIEKILRYKKLIGTNADPVCIQAAITDFCFNVCKNCDHHLRADKKVMPVEKWMSFLDAHPGIESVAYLGGDMATYKQLNTLLKYHIDRNILFGIVTCGAFHKSVDTGLLAKAKWIRVSLDTVDSHLYTLMRGGIPVDTVIAAIDRCISNHVPIQLEITVSQQTEHTLVETLEYAIEKKIGIEVHPKFGEEFSDSTKRLLGVYKTIFTNSNLDFQFFCYSNFKFRKCVAPYYQIYVDSDGDIYPCCAASGDLWVQKSRHTMGNIDNWGAFLANRGEHRMTYFACKSCCDNTTRINYVVENFVDKKNFF